MARVRPQSGSWRSKGNPSILTFKLVSKNKEPEKSGKKATARTQGWSTAYAYSAQSCTGM